MKIGKLHIKISLTFLLLLLLTLIVIFTLFSISPVKHYGSRIEEDTIVKVLTVKKAIEDRIAEVPSSQSSDRGALRDLIQDYGEILKARIWLSMPEGNSPLKSFPEDIPTMEGYKKWSQYEKKGELGIYRMGHTGFFLTMPIRISGNETGVLNVLFDIRTRPERGFLVGLIAIGLPIALLIIPISRFIIKPLYELNQSALRIAEGDLSQRADVKSRDEIGELCASFNHMADKVEKMIRGGRELTAHISHELRTPLSRIRIAEELLREKLDEHNYNNLDRYLEDIREDIDQLDHLIGRILELSKYDIHESPLQIVTLDVVGFLEELLERFGPLIEKKELILVKNLPEEYKIQADKKAFETAMLNILDNAMKYTPQKGRVAMNVYEDGDFLNISVINSHKRLTTESLEMIFKPFHREKDSKKSSGSGLGLAITKKIIEKHGGLIEAHNSSEGLEIRMRLPLKA